MFKYYVNKIIQLLCAKKKFENVNRVTKNISIFSPKIYDRYLVRYIFLYLRKLLRIIKQHNIIFAKKNSG